MGGSRDDTRKETAETRSTSSTKTNAFQVNKVFHISFDDDPDDQ